MNNGSGLANLTVLQFVPLILHHCSGGWQVSAGIWMIQVMFEVF
jgi:hypothetical protein